MILPRFNDQQVFSALRVTCGLHLLAQQLFVQLPNFNSFYGKTGMVNPDLFKFFRSSPLFLIWEMDRLKFSLLLLVIVFSLLFTLGIWARLIHVPLFAMTLFFQLANPMVVHEPQQLLQLLLLLLWFVPYESHFRLIPSSGFESYEFLQEKWGRRIVYLLQGFLGFYYLLAGLKKLPDPLWRSGEAVAVFLNSPYLGRSWVPIELFAWSPFSIVASYATLAFELLFLLVVFTRHRAYLFLGGILFHTAIFLFFDVGFFWAAMWMWYPILLYRRTIQS